MKTKSRATAKTKRRVGKAAVSGAKSTKKFGGKTYTKSSCSATVTEARKKADALKKQGKLARVVKNIKAKGACVYTRSAK